MRLKYDPKAKRVTNPEKIKRQRGAEMAREPPALARGSRRLRRLPARRLRAPDRARPEDGSTHGSAPAACGLARAGVDPRWTHEDPMDDSVSRGIASPWTRAPGGRPGRVGGRSGTLVQQRRRIRLRRAQRRHRARRVRWRPARLAEEASRGTRRRALPLAVVGQLEIGVDRAAPSSVFCPSCRHPRGTGQRQETDRANTP